MFRVRLKLFRFFHRFEFSHSLRANRRKMAKKWSLLNGDQNVISSPHWWSEIISRSQTIGRTKECRRHSIFFSSRQKQWVFSSLCFFAVLSICSSHLFFSFRMSPFTRYDVWVYLSNIAQQQHRKSMITIEQLFMWQFFYSSVFFSCALFLSSSVFSLLADGPLKCRRPTIRRNAYRKITSNHVRKMRKKNAVHSSSFSFFFSLERKWENGEEKEMKSQVVFAF